MTGASAGRADPRYRHGTIRFQSGEIDVSRQGFADDPVQKTLFLEIGGHRMSRPGKHVMVYIIPNRKQTRVFPIEPAPSGKQDIPALRDEIRAASS